MAEIQTEAWNTIVLPQLPTMLEEWMDIAADTAAALVAEVAAEVAARTREGGVVTINPFRAEMTEDHLIQGAARQMGVGQPRIPDSPPSRGGPGTL